MTPPQQSHWAPARRLANTTAKDGPNGDDTAVSDDPWAITHRAHAHLDDDSAVIVEDAIVELTLARTPDGARRRPRRAPRHGQPARPAPRMDPRHRGCRPQPELPMARHRLTARSHRLNSQTPSTPVGNAPDLLTRPAVTATIHTPVFDARHHPPNQNTPTQQGPSRTRLGFLPPCPAENPRPVTTSKRSFPA